jgi:hypothetical protein
MDVGIFVSTGNYRHPSSTVASYAAWDTGLICKSAIGNRQLEIN